MDVAPQTGTRRVVKVERAKPRCKHPGCDRESRSCQPGYCHKHYLAQLRAERTGKPEPDAARRNDGSLPRWVSRERRRIMRALMRAFGEAIDEFNRRGHA